MTYLAAKNRPNNQVPEFLRIFIAPSLSQSTADQIEQLILTEHDLKPLPVARAPDDFIDFCKASSSSVEHRNRLASFSSRYCVP